MTTNLRVVYGVHGYGRGHATRARAVLPDLSKRYDVLVLAGDDAYEFLRDDFPVVRIPCIRYHSKPGGDRSVRRTLKRNVPAFLDLLWKGPGLHLVRKEMERFAPDVVVSDSEGWTHRAARALGIPRISFDHYGILVHANVGLSARERWIVGLESIVYRVLVPRAERTIVAAFFPGEPKRPDVRVVGPIVRHEVRTLEPTRGEHLLVYFQPRTRRFQETVTRALRGLDVPARIYGPDKIGREGHLDFRPVASRPFIRDLASCRAVVATAGNQLISECIHLGKPMLLIPEDALEQQLNARFVERWGIGERTVPSRVDASRLRRFLARADEYAGAIPAHRRDGLAEALEALGEAIEELSGARPLTTTARS